MKPPDETRTAEAEADADAEAEAEVEVDVMTPLFTGLSAPRAMPAAVRERLEAALVGEAAGGSGLAFTDGPRPLPDDMRERLEEFVLAATPVRTMPFSVRRRLESTLARPRRERTGRRWMVAAGVLMLVATTALFRIDHGDDATRSATSGPSAQYDGALSAEPGQVNGAGSVAGADSLVAGASGSTAGGGGSGAGAGGAGGGAAGYYYAVHAPPPYYYGALADHGTMGGEGGGPAPQPLPPPQLAPLRIGVIGGDPVQEAGFRAYVDLVNANGGAGGHRLDLVGVSTPGTIATVNLSSTPIADNAGPPPGVRTPLIESLLAAETVLKGLVFSPASVSERQAHLAVAAAAIPVNGTAVVYVAGQGPFASRIPAAFEEALRARGTHAVRVAWDASRPPAFPPGDAAFVSLPPEAARGWLQAARELGYAPARGIWGIWSLADEALVGDMSTAVQLLAPYGFPAGVELDDLEARAKQQASARLVHGWVVAKWLAVAVWNGGDDSVKLAERLRTHGFESGFFPIYAVRPETNSRTPEAVVVRPAGDRLVSERDFRTDPH